MTVQTPFLKVQIDWKLFLVSFVFLVLVPVAINIVSNDLGDLLKAYSRWLVCWAASIQPPKDREILGEEWLGLLDETPGSIPKFVLAISIAVHAPFTSRGARGLPLLRDQIAQTLWHLLRRGLVALVGRRSDRRQSNLHSWKWTRSFLAHAWRPVQAFLTRPTEVPDLGRAAAWYGILFLTLGLVYLAIGWWQHIGFEGSRPWTVFFGWGVMRLAITLNGYRSLVLSAGSATLVVALGLAIYTYNYGFAPLWVNTLAVGTAVIGATAAIPLLTFVAVCVLNLLVWVLIAAIVILVGWLIIVLSYRSDTRRRAVD
jgi:ABC-type multidrug transport system fused ATPase/permease subunit